MQIFFNKNILSPQFWILYSFITYLIVFEFYTVVNTFNIDAMEKRLGISLAYFIYFRRDICIIWDSSSKSILQPLLPTNREIVSAKKC